MNLQENRHKKRSAAFLPRSFPLISRYLAFPAVVGYDQTGLHENGGAKGVGASFVRVDGNDLTLGDLSVTGYGKTYDAWGVYAQKLTPGGATDSEDFYWCDYLDEFEGYLKGWYNESCESRNDIPLVPGEGLWIFSDSTDNKVVSSGQVPTAQHIALKIPAGVDNGSRLRLSGKGAGGLRGGPNGDLYVLLNVRESDIFERDGLDLGVNIPVSPVLAALGGTVAVPTPDGEAQLKIPAGTSNGKVFRLRGKGVPSLRGGAPGDLAARIVFEVPANLDRRQREALETFQKLASASTFPEAQSFANKTKVFFSHRDKLRK